MTISDKTGLPIAIADPNAGKRGPTAAQDRKTVKVGDSPQLLQAGDVVQTGGYGGFVVIKAHMLGAVDYIPGQSNDAVHWSNGPSPSSPV